MPWQWKYYPDSQLTYPLLATVGSGNTTTDVSQPRPWRGSVCARAQDEFGGMRVVGGGDGVVHCCRDGFGS
ncbi:hypothetical protein Aglo01_37740 [Actinokineospora globicatena]|nr:hypothetical protein Aglo01_37740 [Actinokineospora globicatena]GLW86298.1 hypothetical protein Aglo02_39370 [Actinokineospora globicatena]